MNTRVSQRNGTVCIRPRIQLSRKDFMNALLELPQSDRDSILEELGNIPKIDKDYVSSWFLKLEDQERLEFLKSIGIQAFNVENIDIDTIPIESSFISEIGYDANYNRFQINMKTGNNYQYLHVPCEVYSELLKEAANVAGSVGKLFNTTIREKYNYIKL